MIIESASVEFSAAQRMALVPSVRDSSERGKRYEAQFVCACVRTHMQTACWVLDLSSGVEMEHLEILQESRCTGVPIYMYAV